MKEGARRRRRISMRECTLPASTPTRGSLIGSSVASSPAWRREISSLALTPASASASAWGRHKSRTTLDPLSTDRIYVKQFHSHTANIAFTHAHLTHISRLDEFKSPRADDGVRGDGWPIAQCGPRFVAGQRIHFWGAPW